MGCCKSVDKIVVCPSNRQCNLDSLDFEEAREKIKSFIEDLAQEFEDFLSEKIIPTRPKGSIEFDQFYRHSVHRFYNKYINYFTPVPKLPDHNIEYQKYKLYIMSRCKSREGFFRYFNNVYSFKHKNLLQKKIIEDFLQEKINRDEAIQEYKNHSKGTYILEGMQELYDVLELNKDEIMKKIEEKLTESQKQLEESRRQLERADRRPIMPLDINSTDVSNLNIFELPISPSNNSAYEDIDEIDLYDDRTKFNGISKSHKVGSHSLIQI